IAEKPSLGRNIASAIGHLPKGNGFLENETYNVTWAFGHLFSLCNIEAYTGRERGKWTMDGLPCFPEEFKFELKREKSTNEVDSGVQRQFELIKTLCLRPDVDTLVNAGDADREGEVIVRLCIDHTGVTGKPVKRLWLPDQTPQTVLAALDHLEDDSEYDRLADEGLARTYIDWLYGVNLTRYATLRTGSFLRVGRVIVPIVRAIYERDMAIRNFVPGKYLALISREKTNGEVVELLSKRKFDPERRADAEDLCRLYNETGAVVTDVKSKQEILFPGKLYSLSKLQNVLGKRYKMSMKESLDILQSLYERGFLTYPRTNSEYLAVNEKPRIRTILQTVSRMNYPVRFKDSKYIFDDSKIESHSALTPTYKIPQKKDLSEKELQVYSTVFRRFVAVFCAVDCLVSRTEITIDVGDLEQFQLKGTVLVQAGWTKFDERSQKDRILPNLKKGEAVAIRFAPADKETTPPRHYTIETLNNYLKNPFRDEKKAAAEESAAADENAAPEESIVSDDAEDYKAVFEGLELGTEATRTGIIDNARHDKYILLKKDVYTILPGGEYLIEALDRMGIEMDKYKTSEVGQALKKVFRGKMTVRESVALAEDKIRAAFSGCEGDKDIGFAGDPVGICPVCGNSIIRKRDFYGCTGYGDGCRFRIPMYLCGKTITPAVAGILLSGGTVPPSDGFFSKKTGKPFRAGLRLGEDHRTEFVFQDRMPASAGQDPSKDARPAVSRTSFGPCPKCGRPVVKGRTAYGCSGWNEGCGFRLPFESGGRTWTDEDVIRLLSGGDSGEAEKGEQP
ncbi:MAG: topoisomerase C-terminal repeat-containing protein, partial [Clostridia bacterium]|nr:topoisomerase C-terminal repeat-containing protein [Clostridia bacterium]